MSIVHHPDCDGYGYIHSCRPIPERAAGHVLWRAGCVCGFVATDVLAASQETALALGRRAEHPWGTSDVCDGQCVR